MKKVFSGKTHKNETNKKKTLVCVVDVCVSIWVM